MTQRLTQRQGAHSRATLSKVARRATSYLFHGLPAGFHNVNYAHTLLTHRHYYMAVRGYISPGTRGSEAALSRGSSLCPHTLTHSACGRLATIC